MQTILGAGGIIGKELAKALTQYTDQVRLVSRSPEKVNPTDELFAADLLDAQKVREAVRGSEVVYVTAGLPYKTSVWQRDWPPLVENVIAACKEAGAKLVFFDNIYMYDPTHVPHMTEKTPVAPTSKKGAVRAGIFRRIMAEVEKGDLQALVARAADFYGPDNQSSMLVETVFKPLSQGKKANWLGGVNYKHSCTYTPDAGKATALLGNTPDAYNQVWHLPTAPDPLTGKEWIETVAAEMGVAPKYQAAGKFIVRIMGLFMPIMREMVEMMYQYDLDYVFDSTKFEQRFDFTPTPYLEGIREVVERDFRK